MGLGKPSSKCDSCIAGDKSTASPAPDDNPNPGFGFGGAAPAFGMGPDAPKSSIPTPAAKVSTTLHLPFRVKTDLQGKETSVLQQPGTPDPPKKEVKESRPSAKKEKEKEKGVPPTPEKAPLVPTQAKVSFVEQQMFDVNLCRQLQRK